MKHDPSERREGVRCWCCNSPPSSKGSSRWRTKVIVRGKVRYRYCCCGCKDQWDRGVRCEHSNAGGDPDGK